MGDNAAVDENPYKAPSDDELQFASRSNARELAFGVLATALMIGAWLGLVLFNST